MERLLTNNGYHVTEVLVGKSLSKRLPGFFTRSIQAPGKSGNNGVGVSGRNK